MLIEASSPIPMGEPPAIVGQADMPTVQVFEQRLVGTPADSVQHNMLDIAGGDRGR